MSIREAFQIETLAEPVDFAPGIPAGSSGRLFIHVSAYGPADLPELACEAELLQVPVPQYSTSGIPGLPSVLRFKVMIPGRG